MARRAPRALEGAIEPAISHLDQPQKLSRVPGDVLAQTLFRKFVAEFLERADHEFLRECVARLSGAVLDALDSADEDLGAHMMARSQEPQF